MPKAGVLSVSPFSIFEKMDLKKLYLMYDKIIIDTDSLEVARLTKDVVAQHPDILQSDFFKDLRLFRETPNPRVDDDQFADNFRNINFLREIDFIEMVEFNQIKGPNGGQLSVNFYGLVNELEKDLGPDPSPDIIEKLPDAKARVMSLLLQDNEEYRIVPILRQAPQPMELSRDTQVVNILMGQFPQPDDSISWEQLLDFKNDPDTLASYYALGDWINETCRKEYSRHEIIDKFNHLYHQYEQQYRIHKLKFKTGIWEMLITGAMDAIAGNFGQAIRTTLFTLSRAHSNLLDAESKFAGREVAYIHKAKQQFSR